MTTQGDLRLIIEKINAGKETPEDIETLRQVFESKEQATIQFGDHIINIGEGKDIQIGPRTIQTGFDIEDIKLVLKEVLQMQTSKSDISVMDWQSICKDLLDEQLQLTSNPLTSLEGIVCKSEEILLSLGLVERKRRSRRRGWEFTDPKHGSLLYEETEVTQQFEYQEFLEEVLIRGNSPRSSGCRIAIIGEPGAGKTTLLQRMAKEISNGKDGTLVIWISLADLKSHNIETYLLEEWLRAVVQRLGIADISQNYRNQLVQKFQQNQVWLMVDGIDEFYNFSNNPLREIERQFRLGGLLSQAKIVLTCRLNMWDENCHILNTFDTYRILDFAYPTQVEQFIKQWSLKLPNIKEQQVERLCYELKQAGRERIQNLVKNPLRLVLLCINWYFGDCSLPNTKADLYERFVTQIYEWKKDLYFTTYKKRVQLNSALGKMALAAMHLEENRFRLRHDFIREFLGEADEQESLFKLALQLGWLNSIEVDTESYGKGIYAFLHPTFQEYFAALEINTGEYFLNHISENPSHVDASYRVLRDQWKEVFLFWMGRKDISYVAKEKLIKSLIDFKDECGCFYEFHTFFRAASGITEFLESSHADQIISQIVKWGMGYFDEQKREWRIFQDSIANDSRLILQETDYRRAADELTRLLASMNSESSHDNILSCLERINNRNSELIKSMEVFLIDCQDNEKRWQLSESLLRISPGNALAISTFKELLSFRDPNLISLHALERTPNIGDDQVLKILTELFEESKQDPNDWGDSFIAQSVSYYALEVGGSAAERAGWARVDKDEPLSIGEKSEKIASLLASLINAQNDRDRVGLIRELVPLCFQDVNVIEALVNMVENSRSQGLQCQIARSLGQIGSNDVDTINTLIKLTNSKYLFTRSEAVCSLGKIAAENHLAIKAVAKSAIYNKKYVSSLAIENLARIGIGNDYTVKVLIYLLQDRSRNDILTKITWSLKRVAKDSQLSTVVLGLKNQFVELCEGEDSLRFQTFHEILWHVAKRVPYPLFYQLWNSSELLIDLNKDLKISPDSLSSVEETVVENDRNLVMDSQPRKAGVYRIRLINKMQGLNTTIDCEENKFIMPAAYEYGIHLNSSCQSGCCFVCKGRVKSGEVDQTYGFADDEFCSNDYVLTCVASPQSDCTIVASAAPGEGHWAGIYDDDF